ncbi:MAG: hypothetical protein ACUZ8H_05385 [Candidatus Anammoxibacter sp.]
MTETIIIIGMTRTGTSLTMQMLDKGGLPTFGEYPAYEEKENSTFLITQQDIDDNAGNIMKVVDPLLAYKRGVQFDNCKFVFLTRNRTEQAKSIIKMAMISFAGMGSPVYRKSDVRKIARSIKRDERECLNKIIKDKPIFKSCFENIISNPREYLKKLESFLCMTIDIETAVKEYVFRTSCNYDGFLELDLLDKCND